ncbi:MAG: methyltransferase [Fuerstiella sp.]
MPLVETVIHDIPLKLQTEDSLFSPKSADRGTLAMLSAVEFGAEDRVLDLGCGYGLVGILAAHFARPENVFLTDVDPIAVKVAQKNAAAHGLTKLTVQQSDGLKDFTEAGLTKILSNPPYHADFAVAKHFILKGFNRLQVGGHMYFVTKREGWYRKSLSSAFGGCHVQKVDGYFVFTAEKRSESYAKRRRRVR